MINQQMLDFIKLQLAKGLNKEIISKELSGSGWTAQDIEEGFNTINSSVANPVINPIINPTINPVVSASANNSNLIQVTNNSGKKILLIIIALFIIAGGVSGYYFRNSLPIVKDLIKSKNVPINKINQDNGLQPQNQEAEGLSEVKSEQSQEDIITESSADKKILSETKISQIPVKKTPDIVSTIKPYQVRFVSPVDGIKVLLGGSVNLKLQAGNKINKVKLNFTTYNLTKENNIKDVEIPVQSGYASYDLYIPDTTLVPILITAEGESDDILEYTKEEFNLTEEEQTQMIRFINLYTDQKIDLFDLENEEDVMNYLLIGQNKTVPNFLAGFSLHGIIAIPTSEIEFKIEVPNLIKIHKNSLNYVSFEGMKDGETKVTATYKGLSKEFYYKVGRGNL